MTHPHHAAVTDLIRRTARDVVMRRFRQLSTDHIEEKAPGDLVTVADREAEAMLAEGLAAIDREAAIVGEEAAAADPAVLDRLARDRVWIVDPIDGTHNFAHGQPPFGIMVALVEGSETVAGWIHDPVQDRLCHAVRGGGAFVDGCRITACPTGETPPVYALSLLFIDPAERAAVKAKAAPHYRLVDIPRCAAEQYPRLALGQNDLAYFQRTLPWDHAAGALWLNEAGGKAARTDGTTYRPGDGRSGMFAASSPALWDEAVRLLA